MAQAEQIGLESVWNNTQFNKGQSEYISKILQATGLTQGFADKTGKAIAGGGAQYSSGLAAAAGGALQFAGTVGATIAIVQKLADGLINAAKSAFAFASDALMAASRVQQLNYIAQTLGNTAGYTAQQINEFVDGVRGAGISMVSANNLISQMLRAQLDLTKATELATVAQDAATLAGEGSSDALEGIIHGITTLSPLVLRHHGILVDLENAYSDYKTEMKITGRELTTFEKQQAALNAVLAAGEGVAGAYKASMETAGKQLGSLTSRLIPDLQAALGGPLQVAFYNVVSGINGVVKGITAMVSEGGALYPVLINLGGALAYLSEPLKALGEFVSSDEFMSGIDTWIQTIQSTIDQAINDAYNWGVGLAAQFADGLIAGAQSLIQGAINWISNLLASWFAPHSPPKVASAIDRWGAGTINEWLKGMTEGDYSILDQIEGPLERAFRAMVAAGDIGEEEAFKKIQEVNAQILKALSGGETLGEDFFSGIAQSAGEFGQSIADLARKQYELQLAEQGVADAEKELEDARKRQADAGKKVNTLTLEYNKMLRSGAGKEALENKKKEIEAAKKAQAQAIKDEEAAKGKVDAAKENVALLKEQLSLQKKLVDQLLKMAEVLQGQEAPGGAGGGQPTPGGGGGGGGGFGDLEFSPFDPLKEKVEAAKEEIAKKMQELWARIKQIFQMGVESLGSVWQWLVTTAGNVWNQIADYFGLPSWQQIKTAWDTATKWIADQVNWLTETLKKWWDEHGKSVVQTLQGFWDLTKKGFKAWLNSLTKSIRFWINQAKKFWEDHGEKISETFTTVWENLKQIVENALEIIGNLFDLFAAAFKGDWKTVWDETKAIFSLWWQNIKLSFASLFAILKLIATIAFEELKSLFTTAWTAIQTTVSAVWDAIQQKVSETSESIRSWIEEKITAIQTKWAEIWDAIQTKVGDIWDAINKKVSDTIESIRKWIEDKITAVQDKWDEIWTGISDTLNEIITGINDFIRETLESLFEDMGLDLDDMKAKWKQIWDDIKLILKTVWDNIVQNVTDKITQVKTDLQNKADEIKKAWQEFWDGVSKKVTDIWETITTAIAEKIAQVKSDIDTKVGELKTSWETFWDGVSKKVTDIWDDITEKVLDKVTTVKTDIETKAGELKTSWNTFWDDVSQKVSDIWDGIVSNVSQRLSGEGGMIPTITGKIDELLDTLSGYKQKFYDWGKALIDNAKDGVLKAVGGLIAAVTQAIQDALNAAKAALNLGSDTGGGGGGGSGGGSGGGGGGIGANPDAVIETTRAAAQGASQVARMPIVAGGQTTKILNLTMQNFITNGMTAAQFNASVLQIVRAEIGRK